MECDYFWVSKVRCGFHAVFEMERLGVRVKGVYKGKGVGDGFGEYGMVRGELLVKWLWEYLHWKGRWVSYRGFELWIDRG